MCSSSAPHGWFALHFFLPDDVDPPARLSGSSPRRSRCRVPLDGSSRGCAPQQAAGLFTAIADSVSEHLASASAQRNPNLPLVRAPTHKRPQFIQLQNLSLRSGGSQCLLQRQQVLSFLSQRVKILRQMPKMRLMPRREARSGLWFLKRSSAPPLWSLRPACGG